MILLILLIDLIGFCGFWYIWRTSKRKRNIDQYTGILFTIFSCLDIMCLLLPNHFLPLWLIEYLPFYWGMLLTKGFLVLLVLFDITKILKKVKFTTVQKQIQDNKLSC